MELPNTDKSLAVVAGLVVAKALMALTAVGLAGTLRRWQGKEAAVHDTTHLFRWSYLSALNTASQLVRLNPIQPLTFTLAVALAGGSGNGGDGGGGAGLFA